MAILLNDDGTAKYITPKNGKIFENWELQKMVKGSFEIVPCKDGFMTLVINEEGRFIDTCFDNPNATNLIDIPEGGYIQGNALFCEANEVN